MNPLNTPDSLPEASPAQPTPGQMLRAAREAKGVHLAMLSVTLKVPTRQLEALENDQYDVFKGVAFVRAVAIAMCRHLGTDPAPVLAGLPQTVSAWMPVVNAMDETSPRATLPVARSSRPSGMSRTVWALGGLMLAGSAALIWWPAKTPSSSQADSVPVVEHQEPVPPQAEASEAAASAPLAVAATDKPASSPAVVAPPVAATTPPAAPAALAAVAPAPVASSQGKPAMVIAATGDTWLEVRDGKGQLVINRLLRAGESQGVEVPPPFNVVLGHAQMAKVTLGGKDFDLAPHTKATVARFDIQP